MERNYFDFESDYKWSALVDSISPEGRQWLHAYAEKSEILTCIRESLELMRQRKLRCGRELLDQASLHWEPLRAVAPGIYHVIGRFYYGALAYHEYCEGDFERATHTLEVTLGSIRAAVEVEPCLLPFAAVAMDVPLKHAHIARTLGHWNTMQDRLTSLREIILDQQPIFVLGNGAPVYHRTLAASFLAQPLNSGANEAVRYLTDRNLRLQVFEQWVENLYSLPHFLIPYP